jgi:hypothetical protein
MQTIAHSDAQQTPVSSNVGSNYHHHHQTEVLSKLCDKIGMMEDLVTKEVQQLFELDSLVENG